MSSEIGKRLKKAREHLGLSLEDLQMRTRIDIKYLIAIEKGEFQFLPSSTHARSYIRTISKIVGVNAQDVSIEYQQRMPKRSPIRSYQKTDLQHTGRRERFHFSHLTTNEKNDTLEQLSIPGRSTILDESPKVLPPVLQSNHYLKAPAHQLNQNIPHSKELGSKDIDRLNYSYQEVAATSYLPTSRVSLPTNLPSPVDLGIHRDGSSNALVPATLPSRRSAHSGRRMKQINNSSTRSLYKWLFLISGVLLLIAFLLVFWYRSTALQSPNHSSVAGVPAEMDKQNGVGKPIVRVISTSQVYADRYEVSNAKQLNLTIKATKPGQFEIRDQEIGPPLIKDKVEGNREFTTSYSKSIWLKLFQPNHVTVEVNGFPIKTDVYNKEKDYIITLLN